MLKQVFNIESKKWGHVNIILWWQCNCLLLILMKTAIICHALTSCMYQTVTMYISTREGQRVNVYVCKSGYSADKHCIVSDMRRQIQVESMFWRVMLMTGKQTNVCSWHVYISGKANGWVQVRGRADHVPTSNFMKTSSHRQKQYSLHRYVIKKCNGTKYRGCLRCPYRKHDDHVKWARQK